MTKDELLAKVKFDGDGLVPVIAQDSHSKHVRMLAYMNKEALEKTLETNQVYYYSRSRQELWLKGDTSGYYQYLKGMAIDCDGDTLLIQIEQKGGVSCHTGNKTCFYQELDVKNDTSVSTNAQEGEMLEKLYKTIIDRKENPKTGSYTNYLFEKGIDKILKKVGEEATELIIASKDNDKQNVVFEAADLIYHMTVLLAEQGVDWNDIAQELAKRES